MRCVYVTWSATVGASVCDGCLGKQSPTLFPKRLTSARAGREAREHALPRAKELFVRPQLAPASHSPSRPQPDTRITVEVTKA
jgi:hypothetical protein